MEEKSGFTLVEVVITMIIVLVSIIVVFEVFNGVGRDLYVYNEYSGKLSEAIKEFEMTFAIVHKYVRSFGNTPDEITVSATQIRGKVHVLNTFYDAALRVVNTEEGEALVWAVGSSETVVVPPTKNVTIRFDIPDDRIRNEYGYGVFVMITKEFKIGKSIKSVTRRLYLPFVNVR